MIDVKKVAAALNLTSLHENIWGSGGMYTQILKVGTL
jgi:hypothetical protein